MGAKAKIIAVENRENIPRTDARFWKQPGKLLKRGPLYELKTTFKSEKREKGKAAKAILFNLGSANKDVAAKKAAEIYRYLVDHTMEETIAEFKAVKPVPKIESPTVGEWIDAVKTLGLPIAPRTMKDYTCSLRTIASEVTDPRRERGQRARLAAENEAQLAKINKVRLSALTPEALRKWSAARLARASDPVKLRSAKNTVNSTITQARSLFTVEIVERLKDKITLPVPAPFAGVRLEKKDSARYVSQMDAGTVYADALAKLDREPLKLLVLGLVCGLRRHEADTLLWRQVDPVKGVIRLEVTEYISLKSLSSRRVIPLAPGIAALFANWKGEGNGIFVVESQWPPNRPGINYNRDRCPQHFRAVREFLRAAGVTARNYFHVGRKEAGSLIAALHGIHAASSILGHSDIRMTASVYADGRGRFTTGLGE